MACWAKIARRSRICSQICATSNSRSRSFHRSWVLQAPVRRSGLRPNDATKRKSIWNKHQQMPLGQFGAFQIIPGDVRGLWVIRPDFTDEKVLFGCGTFCVARTPIPMADPASAAKFVLGRSLACCSELNKSPLLMQIHISSQLRSPAAAAPPHVALAALQLQHGR